MSAETPTVTSTTPTARGIDPRGPRFTASITAVATLVIVGLSVSGATTAAAIVLAVFVALFAWGAFAGVARHPFGALFRRVIRPRLSPPAELEDPAPPTFAQGVGFIITLVGLVLHLLGVPNALTIAGSLAFIAAFLNSVFGLCLGCQLYVLLVRAGIIRRAKAAV